MSTEAEIASQLVGTTIKVALDGSIAVIKVAGEGAVRGAALLAAVLSGKKKSRGKVRLQEMIKEKSGMTLFTLKASEVSEFAKAAKRYGVKYCIIKDKGTDVTTIDMFVRTTDAAVVSRIVEKYKLNAVQTDVKVGNSEALTENASLSGKDLPAEEYEYGDITISRELNSLVIEENETQIKTRVPKTWGDNIRFLYLNKADLQEVHNGKSYLTHLEPEENYEIFDKDGTPETITGENLLMYYDRKGDRTAEPQIKTAEEMRPSVRKKMENASKSAGEINAAEKDMLKPEGKTIYQEDGKINPEQQKARAGKKVNAFNNFSQRQYNGDELEKKLLAKAGLMSEKPADKLPEMMKG